MLSIYSALEWLGWSPHTYSVLEEALQVIQRQIRGGQLRESCCCYSPGERLQQDYGSKIGQWRTAGRILEIFRIDGGIGIGSQVEGGIQG